MYEIVFARSVEEDLGGLKKFDRKAILDAIEAQLGREPTKATRHRKILEGLEPPFDAVPPIWQLSVGEYRVFYDVDREEKKVYVRAVRHKPPHKTTKEII